MSKSKSRYYLFIGPFDVRVPRWFGLGTHTVTTRRVRIKSQWFRREGNGSPLLLVDELRPLCQDCWGDLVVFLQGRPVPSVSKEKNE